MTLSALWSQDFRNFKQLQLEFSPRFNLISGPNGAGKTNLLEAIHFLGRTRSFRTHKVERLVRHGQPSCIVRGTVAQKGNAPVMVSVQRDHKGIQIRHAERPLKSLAELVPWFPIQVIGPDSHQLLQGSPQVRRRFLDWGVFHVEQHFYPCWQRYSKALRQRNAALRQGIGAKQVGAWDAELIEAAEKIQHYRKTYIEALLVPLRETVEELISQDELTLDYRPGCPRGESLTEILEKSLPGDRERGFTRFGPHRADLTVSLGGQLVRDRVSRGEQKLLVISLLLAQAQAYSEAKENPSLLLVDDLASELDKAHHQRVLVLLSKSNAQVFLTSLDPKGTLADISVAPRLFHVERGVASEVVQ